MANNLKELLNKPLPRDDKNRASLFAVVAAYLLYMAYEVLRDNFQFFHSRPPVAEDVSSITNSPTKCI